MNPLLKRLPPLDRAARLMGGWSALARSLGITRQRLQNWRIAGKVPNKNDHHSVEKNYRREIERLTKGDVTADELERFRPL